MRERDWGASAVAERLAFHLGLRGYQHVQAARVACDYNRFRGWSVPEAGHLGRRALFPPTSEILSPEMGEHTLQTCFDPVTEALTARCEEAFEGTTVIDRTSKVADSVAAIHSPIRSQVSVRASPPIGSR